MNRSQETVYCCAGHTSGTDLQKEDEQGVVVG